MSHLSELVSGNGETKLFFNGAAVLVTFLIRGNELRALKVNLWQFSVFFSHYSLLFSFTELLPLKLYIIKENAE